MTMPPTGRPQITLRALLLLLTALCCVLAVATQISEWYITKALAVVSIGLPAAGIMWHTRTLQADTLDVIPARLARGLIATLSTLMLLLTLKAADRDSYRGVCFSLLTLVYLAIAVMGVAASKGCARAFAAGTAISMAAIVALFGTVMFVDASMNHSLSHAFAEVADPEIGIVWLMAIAVGGTLSTALWCWQILRNR